LIERLSSFPHVGTSACEALEAVATVPCPLQQCERLNHRAVIGPARGDDECQTAGVLCVTCGITGWQSDNTRVGKDGKKK